MSHKKWILLVFSVAAAIIAVSFLKLSDQLVYFYTPMEAIAKASDLSDRDIRVGGMVETGSVVWDRDAIALNFALTDLNGHRVIVDFKGTPPDMFKESQGVVAEGKISADGERFIATNLFVKHSEEYKQPDDPNRMDQEQLQKSLFKNQNN